MRLARAPAVFRRLYGQCIEMQLYEPEYQIATALCGRSVDGSFTKQSYVISQESRGCKGKSKTNAERRLGFAEHNLHGARPLSLQCQRLGTG